MVVSPPAISTLNNGDAKGCLPPHPLPVKASLCQPFPVRLAAIQLSLNSTIFRNFASQDISVSEIMAKSSHISKTVKKTIYAILLLLLMSGLYGAVIALCNQYLRNNELLTPTSKFFLIAILVIGYCLIYRWFSKRLDSIAAKPTSPH